MDKEFFLNGGIPPPLQYDHPFASTIPTWHNLSSAMEIQTTRSPDCFLNTQHHHNHNHNHIPNNNNNNNNNNSSNSNSNPTTTTANDTFESAMSSMSSSPAASNAALSNDNYMIRELIGKLGNICNSTGNHHQPPYIGGGHGGGNGGGGGGGSCSNNNSSYSTPLSSPPKMGMGMGMGMPIPIMDHLVKENFPALGKSVALSTNLPAMPSDPGFAERAARFSSFGSRSFNGRATPLSNSNPKSSCIVDRKNSNSEFGHRPNSKLQRICSFPALKLAGSQAEHTNNNNKVQNNISENCGNDQGEFCNSRENSSISGQSPVGGENGSNRKRKAAAPKGKSKESNSPLFSSNNNMGQNGEDSSAKRSKSDEEGDTKTEENRGGEEGNKQGNGNQKPPEAPKDYIHVRARRGQATDSHSLAERVRREKISERMKLLQDLVPGCDKVTGKALMLDEIINYVQSLQRQVEFLSMKLSSVNPRLEFNVGNLFSKDVSQPSCSMTHPMYPIDSMATNHYGQSHQNPIQDSITTSAPCNMDPPNPTISHTNHGLHLPSIDGFSNVFPQLSSLCEGDLQTIVQMGFGQKEDGFQPQPLHGSNPSSLMKIEF